MGRVPNSLVLLAVLFTALPAMTQAFSDDPERVMTSLNQAIEEAHRANARLPIPGFDVSIAEVRLREVRSEKWFKVAVEGDFIYEPPGGYDPAITNSGERRLQVVGNQPLFTGGAQQASVREAGAQVEIAKARYRMAEKDLELEVRGRFAEVLAAQEEADARAGGLDRLRAYESLLQSRQAAGQGVAADLLRTQVRLAADESTLEEARQRASEARMELNDLMGRAPGQSLTLESLPAPSGPEEADAQPWLSAPEVEEAGAAAQGMLANVSLIEASRKPRLELSADAGWLGSDTAHIGSISTRLHQDAGFSMGIFLSWPLFDAGTFHARLAGARFEAEQSSKQREAQVRRARLEYEKARSARESSLRQLAILDAARPRARDSYLAAESRYRGGGATSLEVIDASSEEVDTDVRRASALLRYHTAEALEIRWGTR